MSNNWIPVKKGHTQSREPTLTIGHDKKFTFSSKMQLEYGLEKCRSVAYLVDKKDPYKIGFKFYDHADNPESRLISGKGRSRHTTNNTASAGTLFSDNPILQKIAAKKNRGDRVFYVHRDTDNPDIFFIKLRPEFEKFVNAEDISIISKNYKGIYRYKNSGNKVIYIGKGNIYERFTKDPQRRRWDISKIEYSILNDDSESHTWERYYIDKFLEENGILPFHNKINGFSVKKEEEGICLN